MNATDATIEELEEARVYVGGAWAWLHHLMPIGPRDDEPCHEPIRRAAEELRRDMELLARLAKAAHASDPRGGGR